LNHLEVFEQEWVLEARPALVVVGATSTVKKYATSQSSQPHHLPSSHSLVQFYCFLSCIDPR